MDKVVLAWLVVLTVAIVLLAYFGYVALNNPQTLKVTVFNEPPTNNNGRESVMYPDLHYNENFGK